MIKWKTKDDFFSATYKGTGERYLGDQVLSLHKGSTFFSNLPHFLDLAQILPKAFQVGFPDFQPDIMTPGQQRQTFCFLDQKTDK